MLKTISLEGPVATDALAEFLAANADTGCMTMWKLDGYLAGVVVTLPLLPPSAWLPQIWGADGPAFADAAQATSILGLVMERYNEVARHVHQGPTAYRPTLGTGETRLANAIDWGSGFFRALCFDPTTWLGAMRGQIGATCLMPILALAAETPMSIDMSEFKLPPAELQKLVNDADALLAMCVCGLQMLWREHAGLPAVRKPKQKARPRIKTGRSRT